MPWTKVYLEDSKLAPDEGLRSLRYAEALCEAQAQLLETDDRVFLIGECVDEPAGVFGSTKGLVKKFGKDRVMDTPIAENGLTGVAVGAALAGMRPVFVHMRMDFLPMCMDQIINHAAKWHYMTGGAVNVGLVIRSIIGRGWGSAAQHSQSMHGLFLNVPGLKIAVPATPYDAKGMLIAASRDGNPVMIVEHRWIYDSVGYVPEEMYEVEFGKGLVRRKGRDVTVVALSHMVYGAMRAAKQLEAQGIDIEVIDPRTIKPLDSELILESVKKTGRLVIADPAVKTGGCGGEIACVVAENAPEALKAPVVRVNFPDTPTPASPVLEAAYYPDASTIADAVKEIIHE